MPASIFAGSKVKTLKSTLSLNGGADVISSTVDPTSVATSAEPGSLLLNTTSGKLYRKNDSGSSTNWSEVGSGGSGINYISNPNASTNTTGWATYADAAGAQPVDGTGGSPNVTWTRSTTTPLRGSADFNFAKDAANRQGQGVSTDLTIDLADQAKVLTVSFDYEVLSGTYADADLTVYLIADPTGTPVVIQPAGYVVQNVTVGTKMRQIATFQTQATGQSYRLCFHVASTSASAYTLAIDNVVVGPQVVQYGSPVTDWVIYTPTINWTAGVGTVLGRYRRVGDSLHAQVYIPITGAVTAAQLQISVPTHLTIDSAKLAGGLSFGQTAPVGTWTSLRAGSAYYNGIVTAVTSTTVWLSVNTSGNVVTNTVPVTWANNDYISCEFFAPVTGWSSTVQMSNDTDTRVIASSFTGTPTGSLSAAYNKVTYPTNQVDTSGSYSGGTFLTPVSGVYRISASFSVSATWALNQQLFVAIYKKGIRVFQEGSNAGGAVTLLSVSIVREISLNAGDTIEIYSFCSGGGSPAFDTGSGGQNHSFIAERLSGPSAIAASETVAARYMSSAGNSVPNATVTYLDFPTKVFDTHNMIVGAGSGNVTVAGTGFRVVIPVSGKYYVSALCLSSSAGWQASEEWTLAINKGSEQLSGPMLAQSTTSSTHVLATQANGLINCLAGDIVQVQIFQNSGGAVNQNAGANNNYFSIARVGN